MRYTVKRVLYIDRTPVICEICGRVCVGDKSYKSHKTQSHSGVEKDNSNRGKPRGLPAWNKGKKSKEDIRNPDYIGKHGGYRENAGHSKKFRVTDSFGKETTLQSTYELECSEVLNKMNVKWNRPKAMKYGGRNYFADFYLPEYDVYLDPKNNYKAKLDAEKIALVIKENNVKLFVLLKEQINEQSLRSILDMQSTDNRQTVGAIPT